MKRLAINCKPLDDLLDGGIESKSITEVYGEAGSGKTNLCLQLSRECAIKGKKVAYIDIEGVSLERLNQILGDSNQKDILSKILFFQPTSLSDQEETIKKVIKISDIELIILDTFNLFYRLILDDDEKPSFRSLNRQITNLQLTSIKNNIFVIITGQVYSVENNDVRPFAGKGIEHIAKTIIKLEKIGLGKRQATLIKHRSLPEGKKAIFTITSNGLE
jgi:DNA repair protein RadB